jgi:hypothetical protein
MNPQDPGSILQAIQHLAGQVSTAIPAPTIPSLNYTAPNVSDLSSQFQQFLTRASNDPDIVNYYNQLLQQAEGDTTIAENFLEQDYQTGVRNTISNLQGSLKQLGLTNQQNQQAQQDSLNKRGIALTQGPNGQLSYAGGGEAATEVGQTQQQYALQQEAQKRSASQSVTSAASTLQKGITSAGQNLTQTAENLQNQKNTDIMNRANTYQGLYTAQQQAAAQAAAQNQQNQANSSPPPMPKPGQAMEMGQIQGNYKWTGKGWAWN